MFNINQPWDTHAIKYYKNVEEIKKHLRKTNKEYFSKHPEIRAIIRLFISEFVTQNPDNLQDFFGKLFHYNGIPELVFKINQHLKNVMEIVKSSHWCEYDAEQLFERKESSHSLLSQCSLDESVNEMLKFAMLPREQQQQPQQQSFNVDKY